MALYFFNGEEDFGAPLAPKTHMKELRKHMAEGAFPVVDLLTWRRGRPAVPGWYLVRWGDLLPYIIPINEQAVRDWVQPEAEWIGPIPDMKPTD